MCLTAINFVMDAVTIQHQLRVSVTEVVCIRYDSNGRLESIIVRPISTRCEVAAFYVPFLKFMYTCNCKEVMANTSFKRIKEKNLAMNLV